MMASLNRESILESILESIRDSILESIRDSILGLE